jgi:hypothetical protein
MLGNLSMVNREYFHNQPGTLPRRRVIFVDSWAHEQLAEGQTLGLEQ